IDLLHIIGWTNRCTRPRDDNHPAEPLGRSMQWYKLNYIQYAMFFSVRDVTMDTIQRWTDSYLGYLRSEICHAKTADVIVVHKNQSFIARLEAELGKDGDTNLYLTDGPLGGKPKPYADGVILNFAKRNDTQCAVAAE
ncbi:MAG TPA: hypothetical protein VNZ23_13880, partial [Xanthobacteraceae bacterium]|nr:hypothetical protein [Xanthobacteraceae bacterium]